MYMVYLKVYGRNDIYMVCLNVCLKLQPWSDVILRSTLDKKTRYVHKFKLVCLFKNLSEINMLLEMKI